MKQRFTVTVEFALDCHRPISAEEAEDIIIDFLVNDDDHDIYSVKRRDTYEGEYDPNRQKEPK